MFHVQNMPAKQLIVVHKADVEHRFVPSDAATDHFCCNVFQYWEPDTFQVFEAVKDAGATAIDIGAWIGTTSIWLSKNFKRVVSVECDPESVRRLNDNLDASQSYNVTVCNKALAPTVGNVIFGPLGTELNESTSAIKAEFNNPHDFIAAAISFKQLLQDFTDGCVSFLKCDIEGGEEHVLEDILGYSRDHDCKAFISFHLDWWKDRNIGRFAALFSHFDVLSTDLEKCPNVIQHIQSVPFGSLLFVPGRAPGALKCAELIGGNASAPRSITNTE